MRVWVLILLAVCGEAAVPPMTLVSDNEADPLRSAITRNEAWTRESAQRLRADANKRMTQGPWNVTTERPVDLPLDPHDYYSEAPYYWPDPENPTGPYILREGHLNPERFSANRNSLASVCDTIFSLGTAAFLFDDDRYAQRASRIIQAWFLNPKTRMNPNLEYAGAIRGLNTGRPSGILEGRVLIRAIQGMEFLARTGNWDAKDQIAVQKWFEEYLHWLLQSRSGLEEKASGSDQASWWAAQVAAVSTFVDNEPAEQLAFNVYRDRIFPRQVGPGGTIARDESRASVYSAVFNLEALTLVCRIAETQDINLWNLHARNGYDLNAAINYLEPYLADSRKWSREEAVDLETDQLYFVAFAGMGLKRPEYIALYRKLEHPEKAWLALVDLLVGRWEAAGHQTRH
jgi:hypothetical protein